MFYIKNIKKQITKIILIVSIIFPLNIFAASLYLTPASGTYKVGQTFTVYFYLNSSGQSANAISSNFTYTNKTLEIVGVSKSDSIFGLWVQNPAYSNSAGSGSFEGVILNPGYTGSGGKLLSYTFKVKTAGQGSIKINNSEILANDGNGTNIFTSSSGGSYNLTAADVLVDDVITEDKVSDNQTQTVKTLVDSNDSNKSTVILELTEIERADKASNSTEFKINVKNSNLKFKKYEVTIDKNTPYVWEDKEGDGILKLEKIPQGSHIIFVKTLEHDLSISNYTTFDIEKLKKPEILSFTKINHISDKPIVVYGNAFSGKIVTLKLEQQNVQSPYIYTEEYSIDTNKHFLFILDKKVPTGKYNLSLVASDDNSSSEPTDVVTLTVKRYTFINLGFITLGLPIMFTILAIIVILIMIAYAKILKKNIPKSIIKLKKTKKTIKTDTDGTE